MRGSIPPWLLLAVALGACGDGLPPRTPCPKRDLQWTLGHRSPPPDPKLKLVANVVQGFAQAGEWTVAITQDQWIARSNDRGRSWPFIVSEAATNPDAMRLEAIAGDASALYIVGADRLVGRSTDAGAHWTDAGGPLRLFVPDFPSELSRFRYVWSGGGTVLVAGMGAVYRSLDDGATWDETWPHWSNPLERTAGVSRGSAGLILLGDAGAIMRSTDGGGRWHEQPIGPQIPLSDLWWGGPYGHLWGYQRDVFVLGEWFVHSGDGGRTWDAPLPGDPIGALGGTGPDNLYGVGARGKVLHSSDAGQSWKQIDVGTDVNLSALFSIDCDHVLIGGDDGLIIQGHPAGELSRDVSVPRLDWTLRHVKPPAAEMRGRGVPNTIIGFAKAGGRIVALAQFETSIGLDDTLIRSRDAGRTWAATGKIVGIDPDHPVRAVYKGITGHASEIYVVGGTHAFFSERGRQAGLLLRSTDGGRWWTDIASRVCLPSDLDTAPSTGFEFVWVGDAITIVVGGGVFRSLDHGVTWDVIGLSLYGQHRIASVLPLGGVAGVWGTHDGGILLLGRGGKIMRSTDGGTSWSLQPIAPPVHAAAPVPPERQVPEKFFQWLWSLWGCGRDVFAVLGASIVHSGDGGLSWDAPLPNPGVVRLHGNRPDNLYGVGPVGTLLHSSDGARSWQRIVVGTELHLTGVYVVADDNVLVGGHDGVIIQGHPTGV